MNRAVKQFLMAAFLALAAGLAAATAFEPKSFDQLVAEADIIFVGTATTASTRKLPAGAIVTDISFGGVEFIKGRAADGTIALMVAGGSVGGKTFEIRGLPRFRFDVPYLVFVQGNGKTIFPVLGGDQGMFQVKADASGARQVFNAHGQPVASPSVLQAVGLEAPASVPLETFLQAIRSRLP